MENNNDYSTRLRPLAQPRQPAQPASSSAAPTAMGGMMPSAYPYDPSYSNLQSYPPYPAQSGMIDDSLRPQPYPPQPSHTSFGFPMGLPTSSTRTRRDSGTEPATAPPVFDQTTSDGANPAPYSGRFFRPPPLAPGQMDGEPRMGQYIAYGQPQPISNGSQMSLHPLPTMAPPMPYDWRPPSDMSNALQSRRSTFSATGMSGNDNDASEADGSQSDSASRKVRMTTRGGDKRTRGKPGDGHGGAKKGRMTVKQEEEDDDELEHVDPEEEKIDHRRKRRNRTIRSCVPCHNHKRKCDRKRPCGRCTALGLTGTCVYEVDDIRDMNDPTIAESERLRRRIAELEQVVRELRQRQPNRSTAAVPPTLRHKASNTSEGDVGPDSKKRRVIVDRFARFRVDEAALMAVESAHAETGDHGINGTEGRRASGHSRESSRDDKALPAEAGASDTDKKDYGAEPYTTYLLPGEEMVYDRIGRRTFLGAAAGQSMLRRLREITTNNPSGGVGEDSELLSIPEESAFKGVFPDMRKTFPFTTIWSHENFSGEIIGLLPDKEQSEVLLKTWEEEVSAFFLAWHIPSLRADFRKFFGMSTTEKMNVPLSSLSLYLMICSLGCVMRATRSEIFGDPDGDDESPKRSRDPKDLTSSRLQSELYLSGAYQALRLCSFLSNPSVASIQAQILINIYLFNTERAADAWAQTGSLVRQCIAMGLHVDPARLDAKISLREAEVRRRIWWTVAGLDALLCVSFGRPSVINFYQTNLPQDRTDDNLSDAPGTAQRLLPPSNVLSNETTDMTYHAAYFQLTIPSYELLDRMFHVDRTYSRSAIYGWFSPAPDSMRQKEDGRDSIHTYEDAIRLAKDINQWYAQIPRGMRFDAEEDTPENLRQQSIKRVNQRLILCSKTFMVVMVLHRPYLRFDPAAYPESSEICYKAAHQVLAAYRVGASAKASILWAWWTVSYRAFHAGAVCAFLAIRQPGTDLARRCMEDLRGAITVFEGQMPAWKNAHAVQDDLRRGLKKLEQLATAATRQHSSPLLKVPSESAPNSDLLSAHWGHDPHVASAPNDASAGLLHPNNALQTSGPSPTTAFHPTTPLSEIRGFPEMGTSPGATAPGLPSGNTSYPGHGGSAGDVMVPAPIAIPTPDLGDGFGGGDAASLPQFWASVFGIKLENKEGEYQLAGTGTDQSVAQGRGSGAGGAGGAM